MDAIDPEFHVNESSRELLVLAFHKIGAAPRGSSNSWFYIPIPVFEGYLKRLRDSLWRVIDADTLVASLTHPEILPRRSALLTFDDGLYEASRVKKFSRKTFFQEARVA